jgi:hypothetical protein
MANGKMALIEDGKMAAWQVQDVMAPCEADLAAIRR